MNTTPEGYIEISKYKKLEAELLYAKEELAQLKHLIFGKRNERFIPSVSDARQLQINFGDFPEIEEITPAKVIEVQSHTKQKPAKKKPVRKELPEHLRREITIIEPETRTQDFLLTRRCKSKINILIYNK